MPDAVEQPAKPVERRDRRVYIWWTIGMGLLALVALACQFVLRPYLEVRDVPAAAESYAKRKKPLDVIHKEMGGEERAAYKLSRYCRMPARFAAHKPEAVELLGTCGELGAPIAVPALAEALSDGDHHVRQHAAESLGHYYHLAAPATPALVRALDDRDAGVRWRAASALGWIGRASIAAMPDLIRKLDDNEDAVRDMAIGTLGEYGADAAIAVPQLTKALADPEWAVRIRAAQTLGKIGPASLSARTQLTALLKAGPLEMRRWAAHALGCIGPEAKESIPALEALSKDTFPDIPGDDTGLGFSLESEFQTVRFTAASALKKIRGEETPK
jgi:HEAT repeat protein